MPLGTIGDYMSLSVDKFTVLIETICRVRSPHVILSVIKLKGGRSPVCSSSYLGGF